MDACISLRYLARYGSMSAGTDLTRRTPLQSTFPKMQAGPSSAVPLDPPFRGYIETTFDSLLVFEAARRGLIPRVTRRLIERERGMVQSGAVFVFDEQESGIKRWTDGLVWSPSRILGNFLVSETTSALNAGVSRDGQTEPSIARSSIAQRVRPIRPGLGRVVEIGLHASARRGRAPSTTERSGRVRQKPREAAGRELDE